MNFGQAIEALKEGKRVAREGWNGKGMFLVVTDILDYGVNDDVFNSLPKTDSILKGRCISMKASDNTLVFGWLASQTDMLSEDWVILD
jgi:hypothetical protein